jgi:hypothetical protein
MKLLILLVLLVFPQTSQLVPRKTANSAAQTSANVKNESAPNQVSASPTPPPLNTDSDRTPQRNSGDEHQENAEQTVRISKLPPVSVEATRRDWADWGTWVFNLLLVAVGILQVALLCLTLRVVRIQAREMKRQRGWMRKQWGEMSQQTVSLRDYVDETKKIAVATINAAKAAEQSSSIAAGMAIPKLAIDEFAAGNTGAASLPAMLQFPNIRLVVKNYGQTPALLRSWTLVFTCEELPLIPVYGDFPGSGIVLTHKVIQPGEPYILTVENSWNRQELSAEYIQAVIDRRKTLRAYGFICYGDIFGNRLQRFKFYAEVLNMADSWLDWRTELAPDGYTGTDTFPIKTKNDQS